MTARPKPAHTVLIIIILFAVAASSYVAYSMYAGNPYSTGGASSMAAGSFGDSVDKPLHWHPKLSIVIDGQRQQIPKGIGIIIGKVMDTEVSGMQMSPMHTHEDDGTIHMEQDRPNNRTVRLGYLFEVWDKRFDSECIFDYCNGGGKTVKMFVNGKENFEFGDYVPRDKDNIEIIYG